MTTKHQPADAFDGKKSAKNPDAETHPLTPKKKAAGPATEPVKLTQFSARLDPELLRQMKIAVATRGTTLQAAAAEAFELWLNKKQL